MGDNPLYEPGENASAKPILDAERLRKEVQSWAETNEEATRALIARIETAIKEQKAGGDILNVIVDVAKSVIGFM